jgi:protein phosphatase
MFGYQQTTPRTGARASDSVLPARWPADRAGSPSSPKLDAWALTDRGRQRARNEDAFTLLTLETPPGALLAAVADGVGGSPGGAVASRLAIDTLEAAMAERPPAGDETPLHALRRSLLGGAEALREASRSDRALRGLGTTLTAAMVAWPRLWLVHVGDSRAYLWRDGELRQLTHDHTLAERMREEGLARPDDRLASWESVLWNALGGQSAELEIEQHQEPLQTGDRLLLCSDGLTRHLDDAELARHLRAPAEAAKVCADLVLAANRAGGEDNVTVVYVRIG